MEELSKSQKKIARILIDRALQRECAEFLDSVETFMQHRERNEEDSHEFYLALYEKVYKFDKNLCWRYDRLGGSRYLMAVIGLYRDEILTDEDISLFNEDIQVYIRQCKDLFDR